MVKESRNGKIGLYRKNIKPDFNAKNGTEKGNINNLLRRMKMNVLKVTLIVAALLFVAILSGCEEGYSRKNDTSRINRVAYEPTGTGFWHPRP